MRFKVSFGHVREAVGNSTTVYAGSIWVNGVCAGSDGNTALGTDRDDDLYHRTHAEIERQLGRPLTEAESERLWGGPDDDDDNPMGLFPEVGDEVEIDLGDEPGGGAGNPPVEFVQASVRPRWMAVLRRLVRQVAADDPGHWETPGEPGTVAELVEWLGDGQ